MSDVPVLVAVTFITQVRSCLPGFATVKLINKNLNSLVNKGWWVNTHEEIHRVRVNTLFPISLSPAVWASVTDSFLNQLLLCSSPNGSFLIPLFLLHLRASFLSHLYIHSLIYIMNYLHHKDNNPLWFVFGCSHCSGFGQWEPLQTTSHLLTLPSFFECFLTFCHHRYSIWSIPCPSPSCCYCLVAKSCVTLKTAAHQASMFMPSNHLILCRPLLLLPSVFPSNRVSHFSEKEKKNKNKKTWFRLVDKWHLETKVWTSLVVQWIRIHLPMQETWVQSLVWEDPICHRATKPVFHNYWSYVPEPAGCNYRASIL